MSILCLPLLHLQEVTSIHVRNKAITAYPPNGCHGRKKNEIVKVLPPGFPIIQRSGREMVCITFIALPLKFGPLRGE